MQCTFICGCCTVNPAVSQSLNVRGHFRTMRGAGCVWMDGQDKVIFGATRGIYAGLAFTLGSHLHAGAFFWDGRDLGAAWWWHGVGAQCALSFLTTSIIIMLLQQHQHPTAMSALSMRCSALELALKDKAESQVRV